jgi:putative phosphoesterase
MLHEARATTAVLRLRPTPAPAIELPRTPEGTSVKIGLISDTHIPSMGPEPPAEVRTAFQGVDLIIHAGDVYTEDCIHWLEQIAPVTATTSGFAPGVEAAPRISPPITIDIEGHTLGVVHKLDLIAYPDDVYPHSLDRYPASKSIAAELLDIFGRPVDIVVMGYTHEAMVETHEDILFINPGSPTMVGAIMKMGHVATLELDGDRVEPQIIDLTTLRA